MSVAHQIKIKGDDGATALDPALDLDPVCDGRSERRPATIGFDEVEAGCRNGRPSMGRTPC